MMRRIAGFLTVISVVCAVAIVGWQALRLVFGDRWWWLATANSASLYLFLPLAVLLPLALIGRSRSAIVATIVPLIVFLLLYSGLFLPRIMQAEARSTMPFRVMSLNVLFTNDDGAAIEHLVRAESPDLIGLQELNPHLAADLVDRLDDEYPYYALLPEEGVTGLGLFSRYPLRDRGEIPDPAWKHGAQVVEVEFQGQPVLVLNVHAVSSDPPVGAQGPAHLEWTFRTREEQVRRWLERAAQHNGPVIVAGDFNSTDQNAAHRQMAAHLKDAHRQAGWGLGHTFPALRGYWRGLPVPKRLWRLDYVWYSDHWQAVESHVGVWDGQSDHLPVLAALVLSEN